MRPLRLSLLACIFLMALPCFSQSLSPEQIKVKDEYLQKVVTLRHFYAERRLVFDEQGNPKDKLSEGPWTLFGKLNIVRFRLDGNKLKLQGERVFVGRSKDGKLPLQQFRTTEGVEIEIGLTSTDAAGMTTALRRVFLASNEDLADFVPDYWRKFLRPTLRPLPGDPAASRADSYPTQYVKPGELPKRVRVSQGVLQGKALKQPRPTYPEIAKSYRQSGSVTLHAIITGEGKIAELAIVQPAGFGLDEAAIEAVKQWEYSPYVLQGEPVSVETQITVNFTLG
jgi:TonB family protein